MAWLADAHYEWHHANPDRPWDCPLDCGWGERYDEDRDEPEPEERHHIICGNCRDLHETVEEVKACCTIPF